jgi:coenzyme F420-0:L-glutamate ligase/coenzyme F420-1:gamma-L-glutamate ligase
LVDTPQQLVISPLKGIPLVREGDDLAALLEGALARAGLSLQAGDVLVVAQKIVSKSEGRVVRLRDVQPTARAVELAVRTDKDPRMVQLILDESIEVVRAVPGVLIVRHRLGIIGANAGIDQSNIDHQGGECALLLPADPDRSAARLRDTLQQHTGKKLGIVISDSMNRPWRLGTMGQAIGSAGILVLDDRRGQQDLFGRELQVTMTNRADSIAAAALLVMGETTERVPAALVRGFPAEDSRQAARDSIRPPVEDLFL